jgi:ubiquitin thioesterase OTU1
VSVGDKQLLDTQHRTEIRSLTGMILALVKLGYPPKPFPSSTVGETQVSTIPITKGEQIIVSSVPSTSTSASRGINSSTHAQDAKPPVSAATAALPKPPISTPSGTTVSNFQATSKASASSSNPVTPAAGKETTIELPGGAGIMQHRIVPDDNSCLFSSLGIVFKGGFSDTISRELRQSEYGYLSASP